MKYEIVGWKGDSGCMRKCLLFLITSSNSGHETDQENLPDWQLKEFPKSTVMAGQVSLLDTYLEMIQKDDTLHEHLKNT